MRIWSIHPKYLDAKGLVALWRETLLAKNVLEGKTKGYKNHPQLIRFKESNKPLANINYYLSEVWKEADRRSYNFNKAKFDISGDIEKIILTSGQLNYETKHLLNKLKKRDMKRYNALKDIKNFKEHPLFVLVDGDIESWEKIY